MDNDKFNALRKLGKVNTRLVAMWAMTPLFGAILVGSAAGSHSDSRFEADSQPFGATPVDFTQMSDEQIRHRLNPSGDPNVIFGSACQARTVSASSYLSQRRRG